MSIEARLREATGRFSTVRALGRDPSALSFERVVSPTEAVLEGQDVLLFGTNNYLGTTMDPGCIEAAVSATRSLGVGTTGSRIANGTYGGHRELERRMAAFYGRRSAIVFSTGYLANLGTICALAGRGDQILIDADSHASIYDACKMSGSEIIRFRHNSAADLERKLARLEGREGMRFVVVEGIYSMLGDTAPLAEIAEVKRKAGPEVCLIVDEAHSLGVLGPTGRGQAEALGVEADCDVIVGTFSKSLGTIGGFCVSDIAGFDAVRALSRPYMFTASGSPGVAAAAIAAIERVEREPALRTRLWKNVARLYGGLQAMGLQLGPEPSPVVGVVCPDLTTAVMLWNGLIDRGLYTNIALPPATPNGWALLRVSVSSAHTDGQIDRALAIFGEAAGALGLSSGGPGAEAISAGAPAATVAAAPEAPRERASGAATP
ncbi:MAG: aminotransferase class I/II-fold pyridoxal phosphate-dependent enzyme [Pseudomonadota bacterium]